MNKSLFEPLINEGLTTLKIRYDWKTDQAKLYAAKEWEENQNWEGYNRDFDAESVLTNNAVYLNHEQVKKLYIKYNLDGYLDEVIDLIRKGRHIGMDCFYHKGKDIRFMSNMHNSRCGLNNRSQAIRSGGIRRHDMEEAELDVIVDGLNLARAMSHKNVAADIPYGGSKITVQSKPVDLEDLNEVGFLSYALDRTRAFTGPDMGYPPELADVMKEHFTLNITGGPKGPMGPTGTPTAYGVYLAIKQGAKFRYGSESLCGKRIAVQGLGAVGFPLSEHLIKEKAELIVCDPDETRVRNLKAKYPEAKITVVNLEDIYFVEGDILSPAAIGGIITAERIPQMKYSIIMGGANNQLKASSKEEEYKLARLLEKRGILYQCDWWHNIAGVLAGWEEYINQEKADLKNILAKIEHICTIKTWENLNKAKELNITPTECAYQTVEEKLYS
ncbi:MAG: Glu/Leu/Phe/Val dehydrogenase family protein [Bacillota bacterium]